MSRASTIDEERDDQDSAPLSVVGSDSLAVLTRAEIDTQIATAKHYPRDVKKAQNEMMTFATEDPETAASMFYVLPPRGGENKKIQGPSVRMAEVAGSCWGNVRYAARIIDVGEKAVTAQGICYDLEKNIQASVEVKRSIWGKRGRYPEHMVVTTCQAACSIAIREAIFKVIPRAYVNRVYERARQVSLGEGKTMGERREAVLGWWMKKGATKEQILAAAGVERVDQLTDDNLIELHGLATSVRDGEITLEQALGLDKPESGSKVQKSDLNAKLDPVQPKAAEKPAKPRIADPDPEEPEEDDIADPLSGELASETAVADDGEMPLGIDDYREAISQAEDIKTELLNIHNDAMKNAKLSDDEKQTVKMLCSKRREELEIAVATEFAETKAKPAKAKQQKGLVD